MAFVPPQVLAAAPVQPDPGASAGTPLKGGSVVFRSEECPSRLPIGAGEQRVVVTELIGGGRVVQTFGAQPAAVTWSGMLFGQFVEERITQLRAYMVSGKQYLVSWLSEQYYCVVKTFTPTYHNQWLAAYSITLEVVSDNNGAFETASPTGVDSQVNALLSSSQSNLATVSSLDSAMPPSIATNFANTQIAINAAGPLAQSAGSAANSVLQSVQATLSSIAPYAAIISEIDPRFIPLQQAITALNLIALNVKNGQSQNSVATQGKSFFALAAQYYGDPRLAFTLAASNGFFSPFLSSQTASTIVLPPLAGVKP